MDRNQIKELDAKYIVHTYNRYDVVIDHACGATVTDVNGKEYVDFCSGYAANSLGRMTSHVHCQCLLIVP